MNQTPKLWPLLVVMISSLAFLAPWLSLSADEQIPWPAETAQFKPGPGAELASAYCLICHSADYISTQPPMARAFWESTVDKMRQKYGAPVPDEAVTNLVTYLTATYGKRAP